MEQIAVLAIASILFFTLVRGVVGGAISVALSPFRGVFGVVILGLLILFFLPILPSLVPAMSAILVGSVRFLATLYLGVVEAVLAG
jgi:hypothetical protein